MACNQIKLNVKKMKHHVQALQAKRSRTKTNLQASSRPQTSMSLFEPTYVHENTTLGVFHTSKTAQEPSDSHQAIIIRR
jgi:hypothetical protein